MKRIGESTVDTINRRIRQLITANNLDVAKFAKAIGTHRTTVNDWLRKQSDIRVGDIIAISEAFEVSTDWLLGMELKPSRLELTISASDYTGLSIKAVEWLHGAAGSDKADFINYLIGKADEWRK